MWISIPLSRWIFHSHCFLVLLQKFGVRSMQMSLRILAVYILTSRLQNSYNCANYLSSIFGHSIYVNLCRSSPWFHSIHIIRRLFLQFCNLCARFLSLPPSTCSVALLCAVSAFGSLPHFSSPFCRPLHQFVSPFSSPCQALSPVLLPCPRLPFSLPLTRMWRSFDAFRVVLWVVFGGQPHF